MRMPNWIDAKVTPRDAEGFVTLTAKPKRWYALYLSFWLFVLTNRTTSLIESPPIEQDR